MCTIHYTLLAWQNTVYNINTTTKIHVLYIVIVIHIVFVICESYFEVQLKICKRLNATHARIIIQPNTLAKIWGN